MSVLDKPTTTTTHRAGGMMGSRLARKNRRGGGKEDELIRLLLPMYPQCGYLYIVSCPCWGDRLKVGLTNALRKRLSNYDAGNPDDAKVHQLFLCLNVLDVENHVKVKLAPYLYDDTRLEFVRANEQQLTELIESLLEIDKPLSSQYDQRIYRLKPHDCAQCLLQLPTATDSMTSAYRNMISGLRKQWTSKGRETSYVPPPSSSLARLETKSTYNSLTLDSDILVDCLLQDQVLVSDGTLLHFVVPEGKMASISDEALVAPGTDADLPLPQLDKSSKLRVPPSLPPDDDGGGEDGASTGSETSSRRKRRKNHMPSDVRGVYFEESTRRWIADLYNKNIPDRRKTFSVKKWGAKAFDMAVQWRKDAEKKYSNVRQ